MLLAPKQLKIYTQITHLHLISIDSAHRVGALMKFLRRLNCNVTAIVEWRGSEVWPHDFLRSLMWVLNFFQFSEFDWEILLTIFFVPFKHKGAIIIYSWWCNKIWSSRIDDYLSKAVKLTMASVQSDKDSTTRPKIACIILKFDLRQSVNPLLPFGSICNYFLNTFFFPLWLS